MSKAPQPTSHSDDELTSVIKQQLSKAYYNGLDRKGWSEYEEKTAVEAVQAKLAEAVKRIIGEDEVLYQPGDTSVDSHMRENRNLLREQQRQTAAQVLGEMEKQ